ncbi:MAG: hypothetical protein OXF02_02155, partial [Simkaniaceae bacterium]|nr:hypothetical protein [Simkaniaceae bacterium]
RGRCSSFVGRRQLWAVLWVLPYLSSPIFLFVELKEYDKRAFRSSGLEGVLILQAVTAKIGTHRPENRCTPDPHRRVESMGIVLAGLQEWVNDIPSEDIGASVAVVGIALVCVSGKVFARWCLLYGVECSITIKIAWWLAVGVVNKYRCLSVGM